MKCLHTSSPAQAERLSNELSSHLENIWDRLRLDFMDFAPVNPYQHTAKINTDAYSPKLSEVVEVYLCLKKLTSGPNFVTSTHRNIGYLIDCVGDIPLLELIREFHEESTLLPNGFIVPRPVTTTRLN